METINQEAFNTFWWWINERHSIYLKKEAYLPKPWSNDSIFQEWKFCNVFRKLDKQTQWLIDNPLKYRLVPELILFNIFAFRAFNWHPTFECLMENEEFTAICSWDEQEAITRLWNRTINQGQQLTSGAYMIRGREGMPKYESICITLTEIWQYKENLTKAILSEPTLEHTCKEIVDAKYWGWGPFTAYQVALDLTYTPILCDAVDINTWCEIGPGAERGIKLIYPGIHRTNMLAAVRHLHDIQGMYLKDYMPIMTLQDVEFSLCELQKYWRIKNGSKSKERYPGKG